MVLGVAVSDLFTALQIIFGSYDVNNFNEFGRTWQVNVQADQRFRDQVDKILQLQVRNNQRQMIRLGTMISVRNISGPVMVTRSFRHRNQSGRHVDWKSFRTIQGT